MEGRFGEMGTVNGQIQVDVEGRVRKYCKWTGVMEVKDRCDEVMNKSVWIGD